jgi:hypothetical protein
MRCNLNLEQREDKKRLLGTGGGEMGVYMNAVKCIVLFFARAGSKQYNSFFLLIIGF